jgi:hypothetical protein
MPDPPREAIIATAIEQVYLTEERPRLTDLMRAIHVRCISWGFRRSPGVGLERAIVQLHQKAAAFQVQLADSIHPTRLTKRKPSSSSADW